MTINQDTVPPPLMTSEPGSFARKTIVERKPQILREVSQAYDYPPEIQGALRTFAAEIASQPIQPLREDAPDVDFWNRAWAPFEGHTWLDVPWYFAETFFYRRLMEVVRFYQPGPWQNVDPFAPQKAAQLGGALDPFVSILAQDEAQAFAQTPQAAFTQRLHDALWGNRADLSNRTISATAGEGLKGPQVERLLIDDTPRIWQHLIERTPARVDVVADNSGLELLLDLRLADYLLANGPLVNGPLINGLQLHGSLVRGPRVREVHLHLKRMPFFVSDATVRDLEHTLDRLAVAASPAAALVERLRTALSIGVFSYHDDPFWSTCLSYHQMPSHIRQELAGSDLMLFKGDVNYRRLLDDRHWPHTARLADIARRTPHHVPAPFAALRTLKGELIVDLRPGQAEALADVDPTWMINGQRGVVQFVDPGDQQQKL
jgi:hypothetical protein